MIDRLRAPLVATGLAGTYVAVTTLGFLAPALGSRFPITLVPAGLAAGALFRWGPRWWPVLALAAALAVLLLGRTPAVALLQGGLATGGTVATVWILRRLGFDGDFGRPRAVARFAVGATLGALASTLAWLLASFVQFGVANAALADLPGRWWLGTTLSLLIVMPLVVATDRDSLRRRAAGPLEVLAWAAFFAAMLALVLALPPQYIGVPTFAGMLLATAWAVTRMNLRYALAGALAGALVAAISAGFEIGLLADDPLLRAQRLAWNAGFMFAVTALALNAFLSAHERAERRYRLLFQQSPEPVWLTDPRTDRFLDVNAAAVAVYGYTAVEFAQLRVSDVVVRSDRSADTFGNIAHELHRHRDGRLLRIDARTIELRLDDRVARLWFNVDVTERTQLRAALRRAGSEERSRLSRELHDGLGQELTGITFVLGGMATQVRRGTPASADDIARVGDYARAALESCRRIACGLSPLDVGATLPQALEAMVARLDGGTAAIRLALDAHAHDVDTPGFVAEQLLRICQEALANALRHSGAQNIDVRLQRTEQGVTLTVRDDGRGFNPSAVRLGLGLRTLRLRADEIGAVLTVDAAPGNGVCVECRYLRAAAVA